MFITKGHFLSPFVRVIKNGNPLGMLYSVDTDLLVAIRIVGFDEDTEAPLFDLVEVDEVQFIVDEMPENLRELLPLDFKAVSLDELKDGE